MRRQPASSSPRPIGGLNPAQLAILLVDTLRHELTADKVFVPPPVAAGEGPSGGSAPAPEAPVAPPPSGVESSTGVAPAPVEPAGVESTGFKRVNGYLNGRSQPVAG